MDQPLPATAPLRWLRAAALGTVVLVVSTLAHVSAGGLMPPPSGLALLAVVTTVVLAALLGRPASRTRVVVLLVAGQAGQHLVLTVVSGHASATPAPAPVHAHAHGHAGAGHHGDVAASAAPAAAPWLAHLQDDLTGPNLLMAVAHALAAVVLGLWVAAGERAAWSLLRLLACTPATVYAAARAALVAFAWAARAETTRLAQVLAAAPEHLGLREHRVLACAVVRRGPPGRQRA